MSRFRRNAVNESGAVAILVALMLVPVLFGTVALCVDVSRWFALLERVQRAADSAALAAAPLWSVNRAAAHEAALDAAARNGYSANSGTVVDVVQGDRPEQVRVRISSRVTNVWGAVVGQPDRVLTRQAEATYAPPLGLGSSCNLFGNEPDPASGDGSDAADASGSAMSGQCPFGRQPHFWATIAGPDTAKETGDRFATRWCASTVSGCVQGRNTDYYGTDGQPWYFYRVTVRAPVASMSVQIFDPALVDVGDQCERLTHRSGTDSAWPGVDRANPYVSDAITRYAFGSAATVPVNSGSFCTGDSVPVQSAGMPVAVTSFALHSPTSSGNPWRAPVLSNCVRQFSGFSLSSTQLTAALGSQALSDRPLQRVFRQWITLCTITAPEVGDYFLQVRTNVGVGSATPARMADPTEDSNFVGVGQNRFALRVTASGAQDNVIVSALERMPLFTNASGAHTTFLLARVPSVAAGSSLRVEFFDVGDAQSPVQVALRAPVAAQGVGPLACWALGDVRGSPTVPLSLPTCSLDGVSVNSGFNGATQVIEVPLSRDYACADDVPSDCWFSVDIDYPAGARDTTTWTASLQGDPVRLVR